MDGPSTTTATADRSAQLGAVSPLVDAHGREMTYLRVSVTPRCNFRCVYCRPAEDAAFNPATLLSDDEILRVVRVATGLGMRKVRLTGGEPLVRPGVAELVRRIRALPGNDEVALTTNGSLLHVHAEALRDAGLGRLNVSIDTLRRDRAERMARGDVLAGVLRGIDAAVAAGLGPIKFNAVVIRGTNDDELGDLVRFAHARGAQIRFIEYMPMGATHLEADAAIVTAGEMRRRLAADRIELEPHAAAADVADPARAWRCRRTGARVGFITSISEHFCDTCNRMRLTAEGRLRPCLHQDFEVDLMALLRGGCGDDELAARFAEAAAGKWAGHRMTQFVPLYTRRQMVTIGG